MVYSFDSRIAELYGVDEAVFIHNLYFWISKNIANGHQYRDGKFWTYNTMDAYAKMYKFWTKKQVRRIIENLSGGGAIYIAAHAISRGINSMAPFGGYYTVLSNRRMAA